MTARERVTLEPGYVLHHRESSTGDDVLDGGDGDDKHGDGQNGGGEIAGHAVHRTLLSKETSFQIKRGPAGVCPLQPLHLNLRLLNRF